jgi:hypothetical protein
VRLVPDKRDDHAVQVEEEHDEVESELDEGFLMENVSHGLFSSNKEFS